MTEANSNPDDEFPKGIRGGRAIRAVLNAAGGAVPFVDGVLSAASGAGSEREQEKINGFFEHWLKMLRADMAEKAQTILEIMARLDMNDEKTAERVASPEYQALLRKAFRDWAGAESETKRTFVRNILAHAADKTLRQMMSSVCFFSGLTCTANCISRSLHRFIMTSVSLGRGFGRKSGKRRLEKIQLRLICSDY
jgi:hypothetical protein